MSRPEKPTTGGSYVRNKDGSLTRTGAQPKAPAPAATQPETPAEPAKPVAPLKKDN